MAGTYMINGHGNLTVPSEIPTEFRARHLGTFIGLDLEFKPFMSELLPAEATKNGGEAHNGELPKFISRGDMSRFYNEEENVDNITHGVDMDVFWTKMTKIGYIRRTDEFKSEFEMGVIDHKYRMLAEDAVKAIARFVEWCSTKFIYADSDVLAKFTTKDTDRLKKAEITDTSFGMAGVAWHTVASAKPYQDLVYLQKAARTGPAGMDITRGFIGASTAAHLAMNDDLKDRVKSVQEVAGAVIGERIAGVTLRTVTGQRYKTNSADSAMLGYPGLGSLYEDTWSSRKTKEMMRNAAGTYEWALFTGKSQIGVTYNAKVDTETHKNPTDTNIRVVREELPTIKYQVVLEKRFSPAVYDFGSYMILDNIATI